MRNLFEQVGIPYGKGLDISHQRGNFCEANGQYQNGCITAAEWGRALCKVAGALCQLGGISEDCVSDFLGQSTSPATVSSKQSATNPNVSLLDCVLDGKWAAIFEIWGDVLPLALCDAYFRYAKAEKAAVNKICPTSAECELRARLLAYIGHNPTKKFDDDVTGQIATIALQIKWYPELAGADVCEVRKVQWHNFVPEGKVCFFCGGIDPCESWWWSPSNQTVYIATIFCHQ